MKQPGGKKRFSIFNKLVLAFLIVITPLYGLGMYMNDKGAEMIHADISRSLQQKVEFYLLSLETEFERMTVLQREFMNDEDLQELAMLVDRMSTYERLAAMNRLQARLRLIKESSPYIAQAKAYLPSVSRIISSGETIRGLDAGRLEAVKQDVREAELPFVFNDGELSIREYYPSPYNLDDRDPAFVLELEISVPALKQFLRELPGYRQGGAGIFGSKLSIASDEDQRKFEQVLAAVGSVSPVDENAGAPNVRGKARVERVTLASGTDLTVSIHSEVLGADLVVFVPESEVIGPIRQYRVYLWLISALACVMIVVFAYWIYRMIHQPLRKLVSAFRKVESGVMRVSVQHNSNDEFYYLYGKFNDMVEHLNKLIFEVYEQKIHLQKSELKQLQSQINPHFLYNSFYLLYRMTKARDFEHATRFTMYLGDYFQYITRSGKEEVRIQEEIDHVRAYIEIQNIRYQGRIQVTIDEMPPRFRDAVVPRLILQPIVENAYVHGFDADLSDCRLHLGFREEPAGDGTARLVVAVEDNGQGMEEQAVRQMNQLLEQGNPAEEVTGVLNVHRRLRLKHGSEAGIRFERREGGGMAVLLSIPVLEKDAGGEVEPPDDKEGGGKT